MTLNANKMALAGALSAALLWILCSLIVALMPHQSMDVTGAMLHNDMMNWQWSMNWHTWLMGLFAWPLTAGATAWLTINIYNRLIKGDQHE